MPNNSQSQNQQASAAVASAAAQLMPTSGQTGLQADSYSHWAKMDPSAYAAAVHERDYGVMPDPRLMPNHMEDLRNHPHFGNGNAGIYGDHTANNPNIKTSSAFSPIQGSMLQQAQASGFMSGGRGGYPLYGDMFGPKAYSQVN